MAEWLRKANIGRLKRVRSATPFTVNPNMPIHIINMHITANRSDHINISLQTTNLYESLVLYRIILNAEGAVIPLKTSACCSTDSRTIFQKQSATARLKFFVVTW